MYEILGGLARELAFGAMWRRGERGIFGFPLHCILSSKFCLFSSPPVQVRGLRLVDPRRGGTLGPVGAAEGSF